MTLVKPTIGQANWGTTLNTALDYLNTSALTYDIVPTTDNTIKLGSSTRRFSSVYTNGVTFADGTSLTTAAKPLYNGSFESTAVQVSGGTTTANLVTVSGATNSKGISYDSGATNSKIIYANAGDYYISFNGQFRFSGGASSYDVTVWYAKNGTPVTNSAYTYTLTSAQNSQVLANITDIVTVAAGDYIQFYWWAATSGISLTPTAAATNPTRPASPSANINTYNVG